LTHGRIIVEQVASMKLPSTQAERYLAIQWVLASIIGWGIGFFVCEGLKPFFYDITHLGGDGLIIGAAIGIAQGLVVRRRIAPMGRWVLVSALGFGVGKFLGEAAAGGMPAVVGSLLTGAIIGLSVGVAQWLVLRGKVTGAGWWLAANVAGWALGWSLISLVEEAEGMSTAMVYLIGGVGAAAAGIITGIALVGLSRTRAA
jgi:hypothetical protein